MTAMHANSRPKSHPTRASSSRVGHYDWTRVSEDLEAFGVAVLPGLIAGDECRALEGLFADHVFQTPPVDSMKGWGAGRHHYLKYPMPALVDELRADLYAQLVATANSWNDRMDIAQRYPETHAQFLKACRGAGQTVPTSMLSQYSEGEFANLHQNVYGALIFPLQVVVCLSQPGEDFTGGEFIIAEQRPRMQTRPEVISPKKGDALIFAVANRPVTGKRGTYRVNLRHGFSKVRSGRMLTLDLVFHDAVG